MYIAYKDKNGQIIFTKAKVSFKGTEDYEDKENYNYNDFNILELVAYDDLIDYACEGNEIPEGRIIVAEGMVMTDDINLISNYNALSITA